MYNNLLSEIKIGNVTLKNRVAMSAMGVCVAEPNGDAGERFASYYEERAKGGVGLIITEVTRINDKDGIALPGQLSMASDARIPAFAKTVERVHAHGAKIFVQLHHPGRQNLSVMGFLWPKLLGVSKVYPGVFKSMFKAASSGNDMSAMMDGPAAERMNKLMPPVYSASDVALEHGATIIKGQKTVPLTIKQIKKLEKQYADAAVRVKKSGADGVELHAAHGYLIQQFLSPYTNRREDEYGGSLENRMRFLLNIIKNIREACGEDFPIMVRLTVDEFYNTIGMPGVGIQLEEGVKMAVALEKAGVDALDISCGNYETLNTLIETTSFEPGWRAHLAKAVKDAVKIPVMGVGVIRTPEQAEELLASGNQDIIGLGRPLIADPYWVKKASEEKSNLINRCICCVTCFETDAANALMGEPCECALNPYACRENKYNDQTIKKDGDGRSVVVVGAGPAGLTAAREAAKRGFKVTLLEKNNEPGGQLVLASVPPHKDKMKWAISDLTENAKAAGVDIKYGVDVTEDVLKSYAPYAVILATGGTSVRPRIPGCDRSNVYTTTDILEKNVVLKDQRVAVIGSGMTGLETSEYLVELGNKVTIVEMAPTIAPGTYTQHVWDVVPRLEKAGVKLMPGHKLCEVNDEGVKLEGSAGTVVENVDAVVLSLGVKSVNPLEDVAKNVCSNVTVIGDAKKSGRIYNATKSGLEAALAL